MFLSDPLKAPIAVRRGLQMTIGVEGGCSHGRLPCCRGIGEQALAGAGELSLSGGVSEVDRTCGREAAVHLTGELVGEDLVFALLQRRERYPDDLLGGALRRIDPPCKIGVDEAGVEAGTCVPWPSRSMRRPLVSTQAADFEAA